MESIEKIIKKCLPTYDVVRKIGEGVYGTVYHIKDNLKERAVKVVPIMVERSLSYRTSNDLDSKISHDFYAVQAYYGKIKGDGVIEIYDFHLVDKVVSKQEAKAYLVILMEFCPYSLLDWVLDHYPLTPEEAESLMLELAVTLKRLSDRAKDAFIVKDLKPSNLLINQENRLVVGDLGGLQRINSTSATIKGQFTPNWSAPELVTHSEPAGIASLIFSYGFVSYFIWSGSLPYERTEFSERLRRMKDKGITFKRKDIPHYIHMLIAKCLNFKPADRPKDFDEIIRALNEKEAPEPAAASRQATLSDASINRHIQKTRVRSTGSHQVGDTWIGPVTGMEYVWIPSGAFQMGCGTWDGSGNKDEYPVHEVYIEGFWLGKYPVIQDQWKRVMSNTFWLKVKGNNPSWFKMGGNYPVEQVSWYDALDFIGKLTAINKGRYHFRLPTEAEWEYAARSGGKQEKYPGGKAIEQTAWYSANSGMTTHEVGRMQPNGLGLYDMSGNIYEWCEDVYAEDAYRKHEYQNPISIGEGTRRVIRGGSWCNFPGELRCSYRASVAAGFKGNYVGFRVVMTPISRKRSGTQTK